MTSALQTYFDAERGRQSRLADKIGVSRSYMSDIAAGKKTPSLEVLVQIARETGISMDDLSGLRAPGMADGDATPYTPGPRANRLRDIVATLFPALRQPSYYIAQHDLTAFAVCPGDLLVTEAMFQTEHITPGKIVVARVENQTGTVQTMIAKMARPWLIDAKGDICGRLDQNANVVGLVQVVLRSADPAAFA